MKCLDKMIQIWPSKLFISKLIFVNYKQPPLTCEIIFVMEYLPQMDVFENIVGEK